VTKLWYCKLINYLKYHSSIHQHLPLYAYNLLITQKKMYSFKDETNVMHDTCLHTRFPTTIAMR